MYMIIIYLELKFHYVWLKLMYIARLTMGKLTTFKQSEWEKATDKRIQRNTITRRVERLMQREQFSLEDRRDK